MDALRLSTDFAVFDQTMPLQPIHAQQLIQSTAKPRGMNPDQHLVTLFHCIYGLVKDHGYSFQQIEKTFRVRKADAWLIARCRTAADNPATVKNIFPLVGADGQISTATKTYHLILNTHPFQTAVTELLEEVSSYQENFERLSDTGVQILSSKTIIESYKVGETIAITSDGWEEIVDEFALPGTNKDEILALLNTKSIRFRVSETPQLSIADFLMKAGFAPESREKLDAAFGITEEILQTQQRLSEELDRAKHISLRSVALVIPIIVDTILCQTQTIGSKWNLCKAPVEGYRIYKISKTHLAILVIAILVIALTLFSRPVIHWESQIAKHIVK